MTIYNDLLDSYNNFAPTALAILLVFLLLSWIFRKCTEKCPNTETFCTCQDMVDKKCPDLNNLHQLYSSGKLTEFTDFAKIQKENPAWKTDMPYDKFIQQKKA